MSKDADLGIGRNMCLRSASTWLHPASDQQEDSWLRALKYLRKERAWWWQPNDEEFDDDTIGVICPHKCELAFRDGDASDCAVADFGQIYSLGKCRRGFVPSLQLGPDGQGKLNLLVCLSDNQDNVLQGRAGLGRFVLTITKGPAEIVHSTETLPQVDVPEVHFSVFVRIATSLCKGSSGSVAFWLNVQDRVTGRHVRRSPRRVRAFWTAMLSAAQGECDRAGTKLVAYKEEEGSSENASCTAMSGSETAARRALTSLSQVLHAPSKKVKKIETASPSAPVTCCPQTGTGMTESNGTSTQRTTALQILGDLRMLQKDLTMSGKQAGIRETLPPTTSKPRHAESLKKKRKETVEVILSCFQAWVDFCRSKEEHTDESDLQSFDACLQQLLDNSSCDQSGMSEGVANQIFTSSDSTQEHSTDAATTLTDLQCTEQLLDQCNSILKHDASVGIKQEQNHKPVALKKPSSPSDLKDPSCPGALDQCSIKESNMSVESKSAAGPQTRLPVKGNSENVVHTPGVGKNNTFPKTVEGEKAKDKDTGGRSRDVIEGAGASPLNFKKTGKGKLPSSLRVDPVPEVQSQSHQYTRTNFSSGKIIGSTQGPSSVARRSVGAGNGASVATTLVGSGGFLRGALSRVKIGTFPAA